MGLTKPWMTTLSLCAKITLFLPLFGKLDGSTDFGTKWIWIFILWSNMMSDHSLEFSWFLVTVFLIRTQAGKALLSFEKKQSYFSEENIKPILRKVWGGSPGPRLDSRILLRVSPSNLTHALPLQNTDFTFSPHSGWIIRL